MPGVLILEAMGQVGGIFIMYCEEYRGMTTFFAGIDDVRFRKPVVPGDQLVIESKMMRYKGLIGKVESVAKVDGEVVAQNRAGGEEHQNAAHDNDREAKHHGLPLGNELLEVKKRSHIDDEDAGHHIGNGDKAGIGEQSRRDNARPEQDQERDRGEEQYGDDGVRFVGNEVADREYNTHDRQG